jgi:hypothetical protein
MDRATVYLALRIEHETLESFYREGSYWYGTGSLTHWLYMEMRDNYDVDISWDKEREVCGGVELRLKVDYPTEYDLDLQEEIAPGLDALFDFVEDHCDAELNYDPNWALEE